MRHFKYAIIALGIVWSSTGSADILVRGGKIISGDRDQSFVADILISGKLIIEIGRDLSVSDGTIVIDASGKTVTTGLINSDTQLGLTEVAAVKQTRDYETGNKRITASLRVSDAINSNSVAIPYNRMLGLTHAVVQPNSKGGLFAGTAAIIKLTDRDTVQQTSAAMVVKLGSQGQRLAGGSRAAAMAMLREAFEDARDYRDNRDSFNRGARRDYPLSRHDLEALIPVLEGRMPLIVHVDRAVDIERVIDFAALNKVKLIIASADEGWRVAEKIAANKVPVIIDPMSNLPSSYDSLGARLDNAKLLNDAGVTLLFTGGGSHKAQLVRQSAGNAVANGLPYNAAIKAMTSNPAQVFGMDNMGNISEGSIANVVIWSGDPLEQSTSVESVFIEGVDQPLVSRNTRLRDRYFSRLKNSTGN